MAIATKAAAATSTYWNGAGKHQADYDRLSAALVPPAGRSDTTHGELLRAISAIYYDLYNNGLCNADLPFLRRHWATVQDWEQEIVAAMGRGGATAYVKARREIEAQFAYREGYVPDDFPYAAVERLVDGCIVAVAAKHDRSSRF